MFTGVGGGGVQGIFMIILLCQFNKFSFYMGGRDPFEPPSRSAHVCIINQDIVQV